MEKGTNVRILEGFGEKYPFFKDKVGELGKVAGPGKSGNTFQVDLKKTPGHALFVEPEFLEAV